MVKILILLCFWGKKKQKIGSKFYAEDALEDALVSCENYVLFQFEFQAVHPLAHYGFLVGK